MAQDLLALARLCSALPDRIEKAVTDFTISLTVQMARDLINHTPVDTSEAASNWQVTFNQPATFGLPAIFLGHKGSTADQSRAAALSHVQRVVAAKEPGDTIYLSNLTPYIIDLNNGSSRQEPAGFVQRGILVGERYAQAYTLRF